jgi:hypothetical protein
LYYCIKAILNRPHVVTGQLSPVRIHHLRHTTHIHHSPRTMHRLPDITLGTNPPPPQRGTWSAPNYRAPPAPGEYLGKVRTRMAHGRVGRLRDTATYLQLRERMAPFLHPG